VNVKDREGKSIFKGRKCNTATDEEDADAAQLQVQLLSFDSLLRGQFIHGALTLFMKLIGSSLLDREEG